ncbi:MAG TPA: ORF6N domain-containing protein [Verrucomicrobiae bacterium]|nr:ORF6N domain-containing protein [Verrucomicrobiae bacterium]
MFLLGREKRWAKSRNEIQTTIPTRYGGGTIHTDDLYPLWTAGDSGCGPGAHLWRGHFCFNEAFKRNRHRFPADFSFQLAPDEFAALRAAMESATTAPDSSQSAMSSVPPPKSPKRRIDFNRDTE